MGNSAVENILVMLVHVKKQYAAIIMYYADLYIDHKKTNNVSIT